MKTNVLTIAALSAVITFYSCKGNKTKNDQDNQTTSLTTDETKPANTATAAPKTYSITTTPDSVTLGKNKEALVKVKNVKAIELSNPEGEITGTELTYDIEVTNRNTIGGSSVFINPNDFRLELDNKTKLTHENYNSVSAAPEATASSTDNKFKLPAGTKPVMLNLFFDETRASIKLELK